MVNIDSCTEIQSNKTRLHLSPSQDLVHHSFEKLLRTYQVLLQEQQSHYIPQHLFKSWDWRVRVLLTTQLGSQKRTTRYTCKSHSLLQATKHSSAFGILWMCSHRMQVWLILSTTLPSQIGSGKETTPSGGTGGLRSKSLTWRNTMKPWSSIVVYREETRSILWDMRTSLLQRKILWWACSHSYLRQKTWTTQTVKDVLILWLTKEHKQASHTNSNQQQVSLTPTDTAILKIRSTMSKKTWRRYFTSLDIQPTLKKTTQLHSSISETILSTKTNTWVSRRPTKSVLIKWQHQDGKE